MNILFGNNSQKVDLQPFTTVFRLAGVSFREDDFKCCFSANQIIFEPTGITQIIKRTFSFASRHDLKKLEAPCTNAALYYYKLNLAKLDSKILENIRKIFELAINGLTKISKLDCYKTDTQVETYMGNIITKIQQHVFPEQVIRVLKIYLFS